MKNRLNYNPFLRIIVFLFVLFFIVVVSAIGMFYYVFSIPEPEGLSLASWPNTFTDNFSTWIEYKNNTVSVEKIGIERLNEYGLWVQIIDETGQEVFSHNKPETYPTEYSVAELVTFATSKYENGNTLFISSVETSGKTLNYIVGFPYAVGKYMLYYNGENVARLSPLVRNLLLIAACVIVLCAFAYAFWLSRKLSAIMNGIRNVSLHSYVPTKETGVFGEVYGSLNKMDMEIRRSNEIQKETERMRKEWIANITHDLKTPLSPIRGYTEFLTDSNSLDAQTVQDYGKIILKNVTHIENLLNDLKLTYQLEAGAIPYAPQEIRTIRFLKELIIDIANDPAFSGRVIEFESDMPELIAEFDPNLLYRAIQNMIINALVHNDLNTKVKISVHRVWENRLYISIRDNGKGMSEAELSDLWSRYYRGTNTKEKSEGSGLGLAIAKQIITLHGGDITVNSKPGEGAEFIILLPLKSGNVDN